jgi:carbon monoxide dehydrogenase subunit G
MKLASSFTVPAAPDKVVALFLDPATMQSCIPGCEELIQTDETHYKGTLVNEVAHVRFKAGFSAEIVSVTDSAEPGKPAVVTAILRGEDRRLGSTIRMDATLTVTPQEATEGDDVSEVGYEFDLAIRGKLGRLGESVIRRRTAEVERQFAEALTAVCAGRPLSQAAPAADKAAPVVAVTRTETSPVPQAGQVSAAAPVTSLVAAPSATHRVRPDWLAFGLAVAAAFAYGVLFGQRKAGRK